MNLSFNYHWAQASFSWEAALAPQLNASLKLTSWLHVISTIYPKDVARQIDDSRIENRCCPTVLCPWFNFSCALCVIFSFPLDKPGPRQLQPCERQCGSAVARHSQHPFSPVKQLHLNEHRLHMNSKQKLTYLVS